MSVEAIKAVWEHGEGSVGDRLTLMALANRADEHGICWPSGKELMRKTRLSRRGVQECLRRLRGSRQLVVLEDGQGGRGITPLYWINLPGLDGDTEHAERRRGKGADRRTSTRQKGADGDVKRAQSTTQKGADDDAPYIEEPSENHQGNHQNGLRARANGKHYIGPKQVNPDLWHLTAEVLTEFNRQTGKKLRLITSGEEASEAAIRIYERIKKYPDLTLEDHADIIRRTLSSRWWQKGRKTEISPGDISVGLVYGPRVFEDNITRPAAPADVADRSAEKRARDERRLAAIRRLTGRE